MQALREIHEVTSDTLTIKIPPNISYSQVIFKENHNARNPFAPLGKC